MFGHLKIHFLEQVGCIALNGKRKVFLHVHDIWHVGQWSLITSVRLIQVGSNTNDHLRYFLGVRVRLIKVSFKVNKGNKFGHFGYCPCLLWPLNAGFTVNK